MTTYMECQLCGKITEKIHSIVLTSRSRDNELHSELGWMWIALFEFFTKKTKYWCSDCIDKHNIMILKLPITTRSKGE